MKTPFVDLAAQYETIKTEIDVAIAGIIQNTAFVGGAPVSEFEKAFAAYAQCEFAAGCANGTDAFRTGGPTQGKTELWESTQIGNRVSIGSNATLLPVNVCDDVVIGAGAVVTKDITKPDIYAGNPAREISGQGIN